MEIAAVALILLEMVVFEVGFEIVKWAICKGYNAAVGTASRAVVTASRWSFRSILASLILKRLNFGATEILVFLGGTLLAGYLLYRGLKFFFQKLN
jgi:hypothetical protein